MKARVLCNNMLSFAAISKVVVAYIAKSSCCFCYLQFLFPILCFMRRESVSISMYHVRPARRLAGFGGFGLDTLLVETIRC